MVISEYIYMYSVLCITLETFQFYKEFKLIMEFHTKGVFKKTQDKF